VDGDDGIKLMVVGGTHGHEPGTVAAAMNLVHLLEQGQDLAGATHPRLLDLLRDVHLYIVSCLNPDGRTVCPDSFYCQSTETVRVYSSGLQLDGSLIPYDSESQEPLYYFDPAQALHGDGEPPDPVEFFTNSSLLHNRGQLLCFSYEGRQGYLGARSFMPLPTEWEIVDDYLTAVTLFVELGIEGFYEHANREVFEKGSM
jgi:hypothetical protein